MIYFLIIVFTNLYYYVIEIFSEIEFFILLFGMIGICIYFFCVFMRITGKELDLSLFISFIILKIIINLIFC